MTMQDRFRFRVWSVKRKEYHKLPTYNYIGGTFNLCSYEDDIIEQSTGLKDKNGNLIYEGDIVRVLEQFKTNTRDMNYPMLFNKKTAKFGFKCPDGHFFYFTNNDDFSYEVIGNIHENPEFKGEK